jgi:predicted CoA-binding protein
MFSRAIIRDFLSQKTLAVVGVARSGKKFSEIMFRDLQSREYKVFAINPPAATMNGDHCYPDLASLPKLVGGVVI